MRDKKVNHRDTKAQRRLSARAQPARRSRKAFPSDARAPLCLCTSVVRLLSFGRRLELDHVAGRVPHIEREARAARAVMHLLLDDLDAMPGQMRPQRRLVMGPERQAEMIEIAPA